MGEKMRTTFLVLLLLAAFGASGAKALSPKEEFFSDDVLKQAQVDIGSMPLAELQMFSDYLAQCANSLSENELIQNACGVARERYRIEYYSQRPLDRLIVTISLIDALIRSRGNTQKADTAKLIERLVAVTGAFKDIATNAFHAQRQAQRSN
jgi:hypothetical protein